MSWRLHWVFSKPDAEVETWEQFAAEHAELASLLSDLGYVCGQEAEVQQIFAGLKTLIASKVEDFDAFEKAVREATLQLKTCEDPCPESHRSLLAQVYESLHSRSAVLDILNRDPLNEFLPFVERVPVRRRSEVTWIAPVENPPVTKHARDAAAFAELLSRLEQHASHAQSGIGETARIRALQSLERLRRDSKRDKPYLPPGLNNVEARFAEYLSIGIGPENQKTIDKIRTIIQLVQRVRDGSCDRKELLDIVQIYLTDNRLHCRCLRDALLAALLGSKQLNGSYWARWRENKFIALLRSEILTGRFDNGEMTRRLRRLERQGVYFSTLAYALLSSPPGSGHISRIGTEVQRKTKTTGGGFLK